MRQDKNSTVNITNRTMVRAILWVLLAIVAYRFVGRVAHVLTLIFTSFFLALALNPVVSMTGRRLKMRSRVRATLAAYLLVIAVLAVFLVVIIPPLVSQTRDFVNSAPGIVQNFQDQDSGLARAARRYHLDTKLSQAASDFTSNYSSFGTTILDTGKRVAEAVVSVIAVIIMTFMMLVEGPRWLDLGFGIIPKRNEARARRLAHKMYKAVSSFVNGQVILAVVAGVFAFVALEVASRSLNVSVNPLALAGIVAVFGIIPLFGNPSAAVIVSAVCLLSSWKLAVVMLIYFLVYFFIENHTFQPYLQSRLNELTPLTVLVAALLGIGFDGFLGAIVAIPAASAVKIWLEDYFEAKNAHSLPPTDKLDLNKA